MILFPADPLSPRRADDHFLPEARAARASGIEVAVIDHDLVRAGHAADAVRAVPRDAGPATYRGWMVTSDQYAALAGALADRGVALRTSPEQFRSAHELPGWYAAMTDLTPESWWTEGTSLADFDDRCARLGTGAAVLRDYTKSLKHSWDEAAYIPDVTDRPAARRVAERFRELRGEDLVGGWVVRRFESFTSTEARTWWVDGRCVLVGAHPDTPEETPERVPTELVAPVVVALGLPFVTVDLVLRADGAWRVVELGDGQVSDRPTSIPAEDFVAAVFPN